MWIFLGNFWLHILSLRLIVSAVGYSQTLGCSPVLTYSYSTIVVLMSPSIASYKCSRSSVLHHRSSMLGSFSSANKCFLINDQQYR
uniref:Secreted protein n=1 Tax=Aegilops tauschii subsp. strangulata TaxID=200361 RepID=A0A453N436_AEGTS